MYHHRYAASVANPTFGPYWFTIAPPSLLALKSNELLSIQYDIKIVLNWMIHQSARQRRKLC